MDDWLCGSARIHALVAAWMSVVIGCAITVLAFYSARSLDIMSLYALSLMSAIDTVSSILVVIFWQEHDSESNLTTSQSKQEQKYTFWVGIMMMIMGLMLLGDSLKTLIFKDRPYFTNSFSKLGVVISTLGVFSGLLLGWYKVVIARALNSSLVYADAVSSLCAGLASLLALIIAGDQTLVWWADAGAGSLVATYTFYQGYITIIKSKNQLKFIRLEERNPIRKYEDILMAVSPSYQQLSGRFPLANGTILNRQDEQNRAENPSFVMFMQSPYQYFSFQIYGASTTSNNVRVFRDKEYIAVDQLDIEGDISFHS
jgi:uncharacterized membrane protein